MLWKAHLSEMAASAAAAAEQAGESVEAAARLVADAVLSGRKVLAFGNGGSAAQAQHLAAELVVRYRDDRRALPAVSLTTDTSILTACANDYDFSRVFARQVEALGAPGDVAFGLSTSGTSPNVVAALEAARARGLATVLVTGEKGRDAAARWDVGVVLPSTETAHVQELTLAVLHVVCRHVDEELARRDGAQRR
ncbi:MAG: SIS domain-containing protein [Acidobacteria bacterium]|nr:MAG: SIS domain-containing protein [Acidobacteriota bacterium]MCE7958582.1 SIS domain-containing protein [Acidobacteria bacterium ACB2]